MKPQDWQKVKKVFNEAVELPADERSDFLRRVFDGETTMRREVEKMLRFADEETSSDALEKNAFEIFSAGAAPAKVPERIGSYKIVRELGRGGMGAVYLAERETENFRQRAALKIIKRGMDTDAIVSRFRREQKILASLEHPNIARFLDGGVTDDGLPFYAMEYVEGETIDDYCRQKDLGVREKLRLFREVCAAVSCAHQNLVIHRDLKPKNILVTGDGVPKLLDFGIGKILATDEGEEAGTVTQLGMMTPAYASPEQIRGQRIGTTSDVYSLGVILYELLTGEKPYKIISKSQIEIERAILETEPQKPSSIGNSKFKIKNSKSENSQLTTRHSSLLRGDLDNIILKALRKGPAERYSSVQEFSEDIKRHLTGLPVSARPLTFGYRAAKFFERNKGAAIAGALVFLALLTGIVIALWQARVARAERERAEHRFNEVRQLANNVIFKYHDAIAVLPGATATREMLVKDALRYLDNLSTEAEGNTELQRELAAAYFKLGDVQGKQYEANLGDTAGAADSYRKAASLLEAVAAADEKNLQAKLELVRVYDALFAIYMRLEGENMKMPVLERALELQNELTAAEPENFDFQMQRIGLMVRKADVLTGFDDKFEAYRRAIEFAEPLSQKYAQRREPKEALIRLYQRAGTAKIWQGDEAAKAGWQADAFYREAMPFHKKSLDTAEQLYLSDERNLPNRRRYVIALINYAETSALNGRPEEKSLEKAREIFQRTVDEDPRNLEAVFDLAEAHRIESQLKEKFGARREAITAREKALELYEKIRRTDPKNLEGRKGAVEAREKLAQLYEAENMPQKAAFHRRELKKISGEPR
jgi:serine/threonine protein kinase